MAWYDMNTLDRLKLSRGWIADHPQEVVAMIDGINVEAVSHIINCKEGELKPELMSRIIAGVPRKIAEESCCQFGMDNTLTVLGFINGILPELTGKVLIKKVDDDTGKVVGWDVVDRWW